MYSRIVVGTDGSDRSLIAVDHAARLAAVCAAELHVVAASSPNEVRSAHPSAATIGRDASRRHGVRVVEHPHVGDPAVVLMAVAAAVDADLIVVGNKRIAGRVSRFPGSVPGRLAHDAHCPLLIVHTG